MVWRLDGLGRNLRRLANVVHDPTDHGIVLKVLTGQGAAIDTTTTTGKLVFGIFAALAEFERDLISERTTPGLASSGARGRKGGRHFKMTPAKGRLAQASMGQPGINVAELCQELGVIRQILYRHVSPTGKFARMDASCWPKSRQRKPSSPARQLQNGDAQLGNPPDHLLTDTSQKIPSGRRV